MQNEQVKPKQTPLEKINSILDKLGIGEAIEIYNKSGKYLHQRIEQKESELSNHKKKLPAKE